MSDLLSLYDYNINYLPRRYIDRYDNTIGVNISERKKQNNAGLKAGKSWIAHQQATECTLKSVI